MSEHLQKSIEELQVKLRKQEQDASDTKKAINILCKMLGQPEMYRLDEPTSSESYQIRPDTFFGKPLAGAVGKYLDMVGHACPVGEIFDGLSRGGFDWGGAKYPERVLRINLAKNTVKFVQIKNSDSFGLRRWYANLRPDSKAKNENVEAGAIEDQIETNETEGGDSNEATK